MKFKANILLITLFLLLLSSLSALLVTVYIKSLIKFSASFHNYYQSYYIANAGLELALVKTNSQVRGFGFEDFVGSGSNTVTKNLSCGDNCYFTTAITSSGTSLGRLNTSDPSNANKQPYVCDAYSVTTMGYEIPPGGCVPIIILEDSKSTTIGGVSTKISNTNEGKVMKINDISLVSLSDTDFSLVATQGLTSLITEMKEDQGKLVYKEGYSKTITPTESLITNILHTTTDGTKTFTSADRILLMIANTTNTTGHYCIKTPNNYPLPTQFITITSQGKFSNTSLQLKGVRKAGLPADFCYTVVSS